MKLVDLKIAFLHSPLFFEGVNFGLRLCTKERPQLQICEDEDTGKLWVRWKGEHVCAVTATGWFNGVPKNKNFVEFVKSEMEHSKVIVDEPVAKQSSGGANPGLQAQVSTPTSHVFEGPGKGKSGRDK